MSFSIQLRGRDAYPSQPPQLWQRNFLWKGAEKQEPESAHIAVIPLGLATRETQTTLPIDPILTPFGSESFAEKFVLDDIRNRNPGQRFDGRVHL